MRKKLSKIFMLFCVLLFTVSVGRYIAEIPRPDDDISKAVREKVGKKFYYEGKEEYIEEDEIWYHYLIRYTRDENYLRDIVEAVNEVMLEKGIIEKIVICIWQEIPGGETVIARISNFDEYGMDDYLPQTLSYLRIYGNDTWDNSVNNKASTYTEIQGIEYLTVFEPVDENAQDEGIDWKEVWPDLKCLKIWNYEKDNTGRHFTIVKEENYEE